MFLDHLRVDCLSNFTQRNGTSSKISNIAGESHILMDACESDLVMGSRNTYLGRFTFSISALANPPSYSLSHGGDLSGSARGTGLLTEMDQQFPVDEPTTLERTAGSRPSFAPNNIASPTTICWTPNMSYNRNQNLSDHETSAKASPNIVAYLCP